MKLGVLSLGDHLPNPHDGQRVPQAARLRSVVDSGVRAEELGFSMIAIGEHHFNDYIVSSPQLLLSAIAARTEQIRLATAVTLLPMLDPVRVAEDFATLDLLSQGRLELVVGRGISPEHYLAFGFDPEDAKRNLEEKLALLVSLWSDDQPVTWSGNYRSPLHEVTVQPRPFNGVPRVWMGTGMSEESVRRAAESGLPLMLPSIFKRAEEYRPLVQLYREIMASAGRAAQALVGCCSHVHVGPTSQAARSGWRPYLLQYLDWGNRLRGVRLEVDYDRFIEGPAVCGSPAEVAERLLSIEEALKPDIHLSVFDLGGLPDADLARTMELFAGEVMPKVQAVP
ncbi:LLM class flavin-dependent oxidoreductase [Microbispora sp. CA-102843]|uniref:LLM class flavin-dependent oxidoreductase n=1 Tax=Microbispora sp. CA-102843 TaxID=3239952 RepID=UPI003D8B17BE